MFAASAIPDTLGLSRRVLRIALVVNTVVGVSVVILFLMSLGAPDLLLRSFKVPPADQTGAMILAMRAIMLLGLASIPVNRFVLLRLLRIVESVAARNPFAHENAQRLLHIAWAVLALQLLHVMVVLIGRAVSSSETRLDFGSALSFTPWIVILLLFVLARVFEQGARLNDDLVGTV